MQAGKEDGYKKFESVWKGEGFDGEPLVDEQRLEGEDVLSVFTRTSQKRDGKRDVVVLDFDISEGLGIWERGSKTDDLVHLENLDRIE